jgi:hypothetical protein
MKTAVKITGALLLIAFVGMFLTAELRHYIPQTKAAVSLLGLALLVLVVTASYWAVRGIVRADRAKRVTDPSD